MKRRDFQQYGRLIRRCGFLYFEGMRSPVYTIALLGKFGNRYRSIVEMPPGSPCMFRVPVDSCLLSNMLKCIYGEIATVLKIGRRLP